MTRRPLRVVAVPAATPMPETSVNALVRMVRDFRKRRNGALTGGEAAPSNGGVVPGGAR